MSRISRDHVTSADWRGDDGGDEDEELSRPSLVSGQWSHPAPPRQQIV